MKRVYRIIGITAFVISGIIVLISLIGFFPLSHDYFNRQAKVLFKHAGADSCALEGVSITPYSGTVTCKKLVVYERIDAAKRMKIEARNVSLQVYPVRVIKKYEACVQVLRNNLRQSVLVNYVIGQRRTASAKGEQVLSALHRELTGSDTILFSCVKSVRFEDVNLVVDSITTRIISVSSVSGQIRIQRVDTLAVSILGSADTARIYGLTAMEPEVALELHGPLCRVLKLNGTVCEGEVRASGTVDLPRAEIGKWDVDYSRGNLALLYALKQYHSGTLTGRCSFSLHVLPGPARIDQLSGVVHVQMDSVSADNLPVLTRIALLTRILGFEHMKFKSIAGDLDVKNKRIETENLTGLGDPLTVYAKGWVQTDIGSFNYKLKAVIAASYKDSLAPIVWNTLLPEPDGSRSFSCTVFGTEENPSVSLEQDLAKRAINSVLESLGDKIKDFFK